MEFNSRVEKFVSRYFPELSVANTTASLAIAGVTAAEARAQLAEEVFPAIGAPGGLTKIGSSNYVPVDIVFGSRPRLNPRVLVFGVVFVPAGSSRLVQDLVVAATSFAEGAAYFRGFDDGMQETGVLQHVNTFAARYATNGDYGGFQTPAGHWRIGVHEPSSSDFTDEHLWQPVADAIIQSLRLGTR